MNEPGKSDKPVVPQKPANASPGMSFWELFEQAQRVKGRGSAKENEGATRRAPSQHRTEPSGSRSRRRRIENRVSKHISP